MEDMALPTHLQLQIVSADRSLVNERVDEVEIPGADGYFGVLPGHTPLLALLGAGALVPPGPGEALPGDRVRVRRGAARPGHDARAARRAGRTRSTSRAPRPPEARRRAAGVAVPDMDFERARIALMKALVRLQVASRAKIRS